MDYVFDELETLVRALGDDSDRTEKLLEKYVASSGHNIYSIKLPQPLKMYASAPDIIPPYFMGVILGDGCLRCYSLDITSIDNEIIDRIATYLDDNYKIYS